MIPRETVRPEVEGVRRVSVMHENEWSAPGEIVEATSPALRVDLIRMLRTLLDGPLPRVWMAETTGVSSLVAGRTVDLLLKEGIVAVRRPSPGSARDVIEYRPGAGETVRRVLARAGERAGPSDARSELLTQREMEIFVRLLGSLVRLEDLARERREESGDKT